MRRITVQSKAPRKKRWPKRSHTCRSSTLKRPNKSSMTKIHRSRSLKTAIQTSTMIGSLMKIKSSQKSTPSTLPRNKPELPHDLMGA